MLFKSATLVALSLIVVTLVFGALTKNPRSGQDTAKATQQSLAGNEKKSQLTERERDDAATPVVDLSSYPTGVSTDRILKNSRYDNQGIVKSEIDANVASVISEAPEHVSDIPAEESDLIVEGRVIDSSAFLSNDKGAVYMELTVGISDVLKDTSGLNVRNGNSIITERFGGRVKYPNGQIVRYLIVGQGSPAKGRSYVFFLSRTEQGNYNILTAYELQGTKVQALDGSRVNLGRGNWVFDKHNDEDYQAFRKEMEQAVKNPPSGKQKKRLNP